MLHLRIRLPNQVLRGSEFWLQPVSWLAFTRMLRNLYMVNSFLFRPTRCWRNRIGPGLDSFTPMAAISMMGLVSTISTRLPTMSMPRFKAALSMLSSGMVRMLISFTEPITSTVGRLGM